MAGSVLGIELVSAGPVVAATALLGLVSGVAIFVRPELGLLGFVAAANLLPFAVIPVRLGLSLTLVDALLAMTLASWLFWTVRQDRPILGSRLGGPILLYLGLALASFLLGLTYTISPERLRLFIKSLNGILLFFSVINCVRTEAALKRVILGLLLCGSLAASLALVLHAVPPATAVQLLSALRPLGYPTGPELLRPIADTEIQRAIGTSIDPNVLGGLLMLVSALLAGQLFSPRPILDRRLLSAMMALAVAALLLTYSRSALGGLVVGVAMLATFRHRRLWILMLAVGAAVPFLPQGEILVERVRAGLALADRASLMRLGEYEDALEMIAAYPWFGIGFGEAPSIDLYLGVSSMYLMVAQEMGLVGLASFLAILLLLAWEIATGVEAARDEEIRGLLFSLAAAVTAALAAGLLDHYFVNILFPHMVALFWLYVGLAVAAARLAKGGQGAPAPLCA